MSRFENIIINDACVLFDLIDIEIFDTFLGIRSQIVTTEYVLYEVKESYQREVVDTAISEKLLQIDKNGNDDKIYSIFEETKSLSLADCSIIELALRRGGMVLSSDLKLRNELTKNDLRVHGVLWVIQNLVDNELISNSKAISILEKYLDKNSRAPRSEISKMISKLGNC